MSAETTSTAGYIAALDAAATAMYHDHGDIHLPIMDVEWRDARRQEAADVVRAYLDAFDKAVIRQAINDPGQFVGPRGQGMRLGEWQLRAVVAAIYPPASDSKAPQ